MGGGGFETIAEDVVTTDVLPAPWLDAVADAHALPFADTSFANIDMLDVLHHLSAPRALLEEAVPELSLRSVRLLSLFAYPLIPRVSDKDP